MPDLIPSQLESQGYQERRTLGATVKKADFLADFTPCFNFKPNMFENPGY
jgi:hypothetical protein